MTSEQQEKQQSYSYRCADYGRVDCGYEYASEDADEFRSNLQKHYEEDPHRPEDWDPDAIDALIVMQAVEP